MNCFFSRGDFKNSPSFQTIQGRGKYSHLVRRGNTIWLKTINLGIPYSPLSPYCACCDVPPPLYPHFTIHATSITIWNNGAWRLVTDTDCQLTIDEVLIGTRAQIFQWYNIFKILLFLRAAPHTHVIRPWQYWVKRAGQGISFLFLSMAVRRTIKSNCFLPHCYTNNTNTLSSESLTQQERKQTLPMLLLVCSKF